MKRLISATLVLNLVTLTGCAATIASSVHNPVLYGIGPGTTREEVERVLGSPVFSSVDGENTIATYEYKTQHSRIMGGHDRRAQDYVKCWLQGMIVLGPLCEIVAVPMELIIKMLETERMRLTIIYGPDNRAVKVEWPPIKCKDLSPPC